MSAVAQPKGSEKTAIEPFHVNVPEAKLTELRKRISASAGLSEKLSQTIRKACRSRRSRNSHYWTADYNWRKVKARLNAVHDRDRRRGHQLHSRSLETRSRVAADCR